MSNDDTTLFECLFNIDYLAGNMREVKQRHQTLQLDDDRPLNADIMFYSYIKICSVLEELDRLNACCRDNTHLRAVLYCVKPFLDYVRQYEKGFSLTRNCIAAHLNRDRNGRFRP